MAKTPDQVSADILAKLAITIPGLSFELGTPERKIIDGCAESVSEAYVDQYLLGSLLDIDTKTGLELEQFVGIFGFGRLQGRQAAGVVRVELTTANVQDIPIPLGTQFYTRSNLPGTITPIYFSSTQAVVIPTGSFVADVPIRATTVGVSGNVPPDSIVYLGSIIGASSVTNLSSLSGGVDTETDDELRQRFKDTFLRNIAGTADWYLGLALQNVNVSKAIVFGPITKYATQVAVPSDTLNLPVTADVKYAWPGGETIFRNLGASDETFYRPVDDYTFLGGANPQLALVSSGAMVVGDIVDVEFEYTTRSSRNDPLNGITNKVDVFVNGQDPYTITERTVISAQTLSSNAADLLYTGNFARVGDNAGSPSATNRFMRLGSVPIISFPDSITVGTSNYQQGVHYFLVRGTSLVAGSVREVAGLEWTSAGPDNGTPLTLTYIYNRVPEVLGAVIKQGKQITTDVAVHQASYLYLRPCFSIEYNRGLVLSTVNNAIIDRLQAYFNGLGFGDWIEISDMMLAVHQVLGVDNVSLTTSSDSNTDYGVKVYAASNDTTVQSQPITDFKLPDNTLAQLLTPVLLRKPNR